MANIRDKILKKYGVDIEKDDILKIYNIKDPDITDEELEKSFAKCREKWKKGLNSPMEEVAKKHQAYLEKADKYEQILKNPDLRHALFLDKTKKSSGDNVSPLVVKYFSLISLTGKIRADELNFFLDYFPDERKNKNKIKEYLKKTYKSIFITAGEKDDDETTQDKQSEKNSALIENLFSDKTLLKLRACERNYYEAAGKENVIKRYPELNGTLFEYLGIEKYKKAEAFCSVVTEKKNDVYSVRDEFGQDFSCLLDCFNGLEELLQKNDVKNNFNEFKLLIMYPVLTPYMHEIDELKMKAMNALFKLAQDEYSFQNMADFVVSYFDPIYDNFGIYPDRAVGKLLKEAERQGEKEKTINAIYSFFGIIRGSAVPAQGRLVFYLAYWPIYFMAIVFTVARFVIEKLRYIGVAIGVLLVFDALAKDNLAYNILHWPTYLHEISSVDKFGILSGLFANLEGLLLTGLQLFGIAGIVVCLLWKMSVQMRKNIDLIGISRSIHKLIEDAKEHTREQLEKDAKEFKAAKTQLIIVNIVVAGIVVILTRMLISIGLF